MFNPLTSNPFRFVVLLGLIGAVTPSWAITEKTSDWHWRAPIITNTQPDKNEFAKIQLNEAIFDASKADLGDIRVIGADAEPIPYHLTLLHNSYHPSKQWVNHNLINQVFDAQLYQQATIDTANSRLKNELKVELSDQNYYRRVHLEGSHDLSDWQLITNNPILIDINAEQSYRQDTITFSENNFRYLRITVFQMPDNITSFSIKSVSSRKRIAASIPELPVVISDQKVTLDSDNNTVVELDLAYKNLPIRNILLDFAEPRYYRAFKVEGTNSLITPPQDVARKKPMSPPVWKLLSRGVFYRIQNSDGSESEHNLVSFGGQPSFRHLKITILNQDNPALSLASVKVERAERSIIFPTTPAAPQFLLYGNAKVTAPQYDLIKAYPRLENEAMDTLALGSAEALSPSSDQLPWSERNQWLLGLILGLCMAILGYGVFRQLKKPLSDTT